LRHLGLSAFAPATEGAAAKLGRVLPDALREGANAVDEVVDIEPGPWVISTSAEALIRVCTAVRTRHVVAFAYESHQHAATRREVEPYGIVHTDGRWYMVGRCRLRKALRTFRLDRVSVVELRDVVFERPADFDAKAHLERSMPFVDSGFNVEVWLDLPIDCARSMFELHRVSLEPEGGGTRLRCSRSRLQPFAAMLLKWGCAVHVREPRELAAVFEGLATRAAQAAASYGSGSGSASGGVSAATGA
jgi:predicted DNA-binding transcriptional regulator YafY